MKLNRFLNLAVVVLLFVMSPAALFAQAQLNPQQQQLADYIKANYTKREVLIPMRDGVKLFTSIYEPKDASQKYPILLNRTPYTVAPYGADKYRASLGPDELFAREGYFFVNQDVRGRPKLEKTLYFASSSDDIAGGTQLFADILGKNAPSGVRWHYEKMPDEKHSTIYHPAALKAFRELFKPIAGK